MEYKRLTEKKIDLEKLSNKAKSKISDTYLDYAKMNNALWELENKIENGTLIELPCKIGTMVYRIIYSACSWGKIKIGFNIHETEFTLSIFEEMLEDKLPYIFLTKGEAEKKLKELQNGRND